MHNTKIDITLEQIERIFFAAMRRGYAGKEKVEKQEIPVLPGYKCIPFVSENFTVLDAWCDTSLNDTSAGFTTIWFRDIPVWTMSYSGFYASKYIAFLKLALRQTYEKSACVGCRGPAAFSHPYYPDLTYINRVDEGRDMFGSLFANFAGIEYIYDTDGGKRAGYHRYQGMSML